MRNLLKTSFQKNLEIQKALAKQGICFLFAKQEQWDNETRHRRGEYLIPAAPRSGDEKVCKAGFFCLRNKLTGRRSLSSIFFYRKMR